VGARRSGAVAVVVAALAALGVAGAVHFLEPEADEPERGVAAVADASVDARAGHPRPKAAPGKKRAVRGGKTRVAGHGGGHGTAGHAGAAGHPSAAGHGSGEGPSAGGHARGGAPTGATYEAAVGSNNEQLAFGATGRPDLTDAQLSAPMSDGTFVSDCGAPDSMSVTVKVAIRMGRAVGVTVSTSPPDAEVAGCIDRHVRGLSWPPSPKMDSFVTSY
jgi:hypothetical protein